MTEENGQVSPLFMNSVNLGWFKLKPSCLELKPVTVLTDTSDAAAALTRAKDGDATI